MKMVLVSADVDSWLRFAFAKGVQRLELDLSFCLVLDVEGVPFPLALPRLDKLEEFEVRLLGLDGNSLLWPTVFIKASPYLRRFAIEMNVCSTTDSIGHHSEEEKRRIKEATKFRHGFLKVVEIGGFNGWNNEVELAQHLIDIGAQSIKKVIIDSRSPIFDTTSPLVVHQNEAQDLKKLAQSLGEGLDSSVNFQVL